MYINSREIRHLESMCFQSNNYHKNFGFSRMRYSHFMSDEDFDDQQKYVITNNMTLNELKMCLGEDFIQTDLLEVDTYFKNPQKNMMSKDAFIEMMSTDAFMNRFPFRKKDKKPSDIDYRMMRIQYSMGMSVYPELENLMYLKDSLNFKELVDAWKIFAMDNNINIDELLNPMMEILKNSPFNNKIFEKIEQTKKELFYKIKSVSFDLDDRYGNKHYLGIDHDIEEMSSVDITVLSAKLADIEELLATIEKDLECFNKNVDTKKLMNPENIKNNSDVLITVLENIFESLKEKINITHAEAVNFVNNKESYENRFNLFKDKIMLAVDNVSLNKHCFQKVVVFKDQTIAVLSKENEKFTLYTSIKDTKNLIQRSLGVYLKNELRKNPTISKTLTNIFENKVNQINNESNRNLYVLKNEFSFGKILSCIETYYAHQNILKSENFDFIEQIEKQSSFEKLDDKMNKIIREHKIKKYAESIVSNKYKHLYNKESYKLFKELYDLKIDKNIIQDILGKKIAAVKSKVSFNENIKSLLNSFNDFDINTIKIKAKSIKAKIIVETESKLILEIDSFDQSKLLGSPSWCISRNEGYFLDYIKNQGKQYFIYDFAQTSKSSKSLVGITLTKNFEMKAGHSKNDAALRDKSLVEYVINQVKNHYEVKEIG